MKPHTTLSRVPYALAATGICAGLAACGGSGGSPEAATIQTLSNRADLISGGQALVEIKLPASVSASKIKVDVDGVDVTSSFMTTPGGRILGVVNGLKNGVNRVNVRPVDDSFAGARLLVTNHSFAGPIISGEPVEPWICATPTGAPVTVSAPGTNLSASVTSRMSGLEQGPLDAKCSGPTKFTYYYVPKGLEGFANCTFGVTGANPCFVPFQPTSRPADASIADFTNDRGDTVKALLRVELGTVNRGMYEIATWFDPAVNSSPWAPQKGWNQKLLFKMGFSLSGNRFQMMPDAGRKMSGSGGLFDVNGLRAGYMVAHATMTDHFSNNNEYVAAETMMMVKEHIVDHYGEIRYTMSNGQSGGSIMQTVIASAIPGLLDGLLPAASYPDSVSGFFLEARECGQLVQYYRTPNGAGLTPAQRAAINGDPNDLWCPNWESRYVRPQDPQVVNNCGAGFPAALVYHPVLRPNGVRCSTNDMQVSMWGSFVDADGNRKTRLPYDNVGVQYGLKALQGGVITAEDFVRLNEGVGSYGADMVWSGGSATAPVVPAPRERADPEVLRTVYRSGLVADGKALAEVPIIDLRADNGTPDLHERWKSWATRDRIAQATGGHGNHVIRAGFGIPPGGPPGLAAVREAFLLMDRWLGAIEADKTDTAKAEKVLKNKPADVADACFAQPGATEDQLVNLGLESAACPIKPEASPRQMAGGPRAENILKCQLKPLNFGDADYAGVTFSASQQGRLRTVFPEGVCDWSRPGVGQQAATPTLTFVGGPGGVPLPAAPRWSRL